MRKLFIENLPIAGKTVLMRVDFNVPLDNDLNVIDTTRIEAALPSIRYVLDRGGTLILMSHLGRPHHIFNPDFSLAPVANVLCAFLGRSVQMAPDCIGDEVARMVQNLAAGEILMLENLRFHRAEQYPNEDSSFAQKLASLADLYVNDAFGTAHRKHSSTYTITNYFPGKAAAGYLFEKEIYCLGEMLENPSRPFYALIGGAKISTKIGVIKSLLKKVDRLLIGGGMAYTFLQADGIEIGHSLVEEELVPLAADMLKESRSKILLPVDTLAALECSEDAEVQHIVLAKDFLKNYQGLDIGPQTVELFCKTLQNAKTILWNGPFGVYEFDQFARGTEKLISYLGGLSASTIIGGGDLVAAVNKSGVANKITHISTGGGATLEYIEFGTLPGIEALSNQVEGNLKSQF